MLPLPKVILFDADGTLYESERLNFEANRLTARELHGFDLTWEEFDLKVRRGDRVPYEILVEYGHKVHPETYLQRRHHHYLRLVGEELRPVDGLTDFLMWCQARRLRRIIVTSGRKQTVEASLEVLGLTSFFEYTVTLEAAAHARKPDPYAYELGLRIAGVPAAETWAIEDTGKGIEAAQGAGLYCIAVRNSTNTDTELQKADLIVDNYLQLLRYCIKGA